MERKKRFLQEHNDVRWNNRCTVPMEIIVLLSFCTYQGINEIEDFRFYSAQQTTKSKEKQINKFVHQKLGDKLMEKRGGEGATPSLPVIKLF